MKVDGGAPDTPEGDAPEESKQPAFDTAARADASADLGATTVLVPPAFDTDATIAVTGAAVDAGATAAFEGVPADSDSTLALSPPATGAEVQPGSQVFRITADDSAPPVPAAWPKVKSRRRRGRWVAALAPLSVVAAAGIVALILYNRLGSSGPALSVTGISITAPSTAGCGQAVTVSAIINTDGGAGTIAYKWSRSDGQQGPEQHLNATRDQTSYPVTLTWSIQGRGRFDAVATMTITSPSGTNPAVARFLYSC